MKKGARGFTLVELVAVLLIIGILAASAISGSLPSSSFQLQASRDQVVTAFFAAQQRAMAQTTPVCFLTQAPNTVDIRFDTDADGNCAGEPSVRAGGTAYPVSLSANQSISTTSLIFDRLGRPNATPTLLLSQAEGSVNISIGAAGYIE